MAEQNGPSNGGGDTRDTTTFSGSFGSSNSIGVMSTEKYSETYNMSHNYRGKCIIINNKMFSHTTGLSERSGTDVDAAHLLRLFQKLGFIVEHHPDLTVSKMRDVIKDTAKWEHNGESDCAVIIILTHGDMGVLYGTNGKLAIEEVFKPFRGDKCPALAGKPKIFFIQACQGDKLDEGVVLQKEQDQMDADEGYRIPTYADFLICSSTIPGYYSWRNKSDGSWFIQALCHVLENADHTKDDLLSLMTKVNCRVSYHHESDVPRKLNMHKKKQSPCITSMLTRKVYLVPKQLPQHS